MILAALIVGLAPNLVSLNIAVQVMNALLLPLVLGFLYALAVRALPAEVRLRGWYRWLVLAIGALVCALGIWGGIAGLFQN